MKTERYSNQKARPKERDQNGRALCRHCGEPVNEPRRRWWHAKCAHAYLMAKDGNYVRQQVFKRDRGVCSMCGLNAHTAQREAGKTLRTLFGDERKEFISEITKAGFNLMSSWWEADHIVAVADGGGQCDLDNFRTLCTPCHKKRTAEWHRLRSKSSPARAEPSQSSQPLAT